MLQANGAMWPSQEPKAIDAVQTMIDGIMDVGVIITNMEGRVIAYNNAASFADHVDKKTAIGMSYRDIYLDTDGGIIQQVMQLRKPVLNQAQEYQFSNQETMVSVDSAYPIYKDNEMIGVFSITRYVGKSLDAMQRVYDYHSKTEIQRPKTANGTRYVFSDIIGTGPAIQTAIHKGIRAARSSASVFLEGETGTGKEMFAQSIHNASDRVGKPFIGLNCAAIPENLLESILFGTTKGAFTGAENKAGLFEQAKDGTFFLDEINSMPLYLQAKLLRVIQERRVRRIGAQTETEISCRLITSCNQRVEQCIQEGLLRDDLFYRLSVIKIDLVPLREHKEDISVYMGAFLERFAKAYGCKIQGITPQFREAMYDYSWPGNIRELEHVVESAVVMMDDSGVLSLSDLPANIANAYRNANPGGEHADGEGYLKDFLQDAEREMLLQKLRENNWNITHTANAMGLSRSNLQYRLRKMHIVRPDEARDSV